MKTCRGVFERCSSARMTWRNLEIVIVHHIGQVVEAGAVGPLDDVVLLAGPVELDPAANLVVEDERSGGGHLQSHHGLPALRLELGPLGGRFGHELPAVAELPLLALGRLAFGLKLLGRGIVVVRMAAGQQLLDRGPVTVQPLRLVIRSERPAHLRPLVPVDAQPVEAVEDRLQSLLDVPLLVGVVDPQDKLPTVLPGEEPIEQGGADPADVEVSGRAGGEAGADHAIWDFMIWDLGLGAHVRQRQS